jgi:hypothetical protein
MTELRAGHWFQTHSQKKFYPLDPRVEDISINDIGHSLAKLCRYNGHCRYPYSVGQHSVCVSLIVGKRAPEHALWALLHDAAEAYVGDMVRPLKQCGSMRPFRDAEAGVMFQVTKHFGLTLWEPDVVKEIDDRILFSEANHILQGGYELWGVHGEAIRDDEWPDDMLAQFGEIAGRYVGDQNQVVDLRTFPELPWRAVHHMFMERFNMLWRAAGHQSVFER